VRNGIVRNGQVVTSSTVTGSVTPKKGEISKGGLIDTPSDVGGYPELSPGSQIADSDRDGMPDAWEDEKGLDKNDFKDGKLFTLDKSHTNLEVYLHSLVADLY
jgi:hypothetical protein